MAGSRPPTPGRELYFVSGAGVYLRPMGGEPAFNIWFQELGGNSRIHVNNEDAIAEGPTKTQIMFAIRPFADAALMDNDFVRTRSDWLADQLSGLLAVCDNRGVYRFLSRDRR